MRFCLKNLCVFTLLNLGLLSCSGGSKDTPIQIAFTSFLGGTSSFPGGLIITGESDKGDRFVENVTSDVLELELSNGTWRFATVGWDGPSEMNGNTYCDTKYGVKLSGSDISVSLVLSTAKCVDPVFGSDETGASVADASNGFYTATVTNCLNIQNFFLEEGHNVVPNDFVCDGTGDNPFDGQLASFKIKIPEVQGSVLDSSSALESTCYNFSSSAATTTVRLPYGSTIFYLPYQIATFDGAGCTGTESTYVYDQGLQATTAAVDGGTTIDGGSTELELYLHVDACVTTAHLTGSPFALSVGGVRHLICTETQFGQIITDLDGSYELGADIDFGGDNTMISGTFNGSLDGRDYTLKNGDEPLFDILGTGATDTEITRVSIDNFVLSFGSNTGQNYGVLARTYNANGSAYKFNVRELSVTNSSVEIAGGSSNNLGGLIGYVNFGGGGTGEYLQIEDNIINVDVTNPGSGSYLGGVIGHVNNTSTGIVSLDDNLIGYDTSDPTYRNILAGDATTGATGGVVGFGYGVSIWDGNYVYAQVEDSLSNIGGLIGTTNNVTIESSFVDLVVVPPVSPVSNVGGAVGNVTTDTALSIDGVVAYLDFVDTAATLHQKIGGLIGEVNNTSPATNFSIEQSKASVYIDADGSYFGGLVGNMTHGQNMGTPNTNILGSVAEGAIYAYSDTTNQKRGGMFGYASKVQVEKVLWLLTLKVRSNLEVLSVSQARESF